MEDLRIKTVSVKYAVRWYDNQGEHQARATTLLELREEYADRLLTAGGFPYGSPAVCPLYKRGGRKRAITLSPLPETAGRESKT